MFRVLYAIQGTGNGHMARAREVLPHLQQLAQVDVLVSGQAHQVKLAQEICYFYRGITMHYDSSGGVNMATTLRNNNWASFCREVKSCPVQDYDLVINDFEPVSAWACRLRKVPCTGFGHQAAFRLPGAPRSPKKNLWAEGILRYYAPAHQHKGLHFRSYAANIFPPVIRSEIREATPTVGDHFTVYLPAYGMPFLEKLLQNISNVNWEVFHPACQKPWSRGAVQFRPIDQENFLKSFLHCQGVLTSAGFETPAAALYLGKKLLVVPIRKQYEQSLNAAALAELGIPVLRHLGGRSVQILRNWVYGAQPQRELSPHHLPQTLEEILAEHAETNQAAREQSQAADPRAAPSFINS